MMKAVCRVSKPEKRATYLSIRKTGRLLFSHRFYNVGRLMVNKQSKVKQSKAKRRHASKSTKSSVRIALSLYIKAGHVTWIHPICGPPLFSPVHM